MLSGRRLNLLDPSPLDVEIEDIAHGLARVARWNGQTRGEHAFSVAQHSLLVEDILAMQAAEAPPRLRLLALLHDAPEYVIGDIISPFKVAVGDRYRAVEARLAAAIHIRFGLAAEPDARQKRALKRADRTAAYFEAVHLAGFSVREAEAFFGPPRDVRPDARALRPLPTGQAQEQFLMRFQALQELAETPAAGRLMAGRT